MLVRSPLVFFVYITVSIPGENFSDKNIDVDTKKGHEKEKQILLHRQSENISYYLIFRKRPEPQSYRKLIPNDGNEKQHEQCDAKRLEMYFFPIDIQQKYIWDDDKHEEELKVQVHGKKNDVLI